MCVPLYAYIYIRAQDTTHMFSRLVNSPGDPKTISNHALINDQPRTLLPLMVDCVVCTHTHIHCGYFTALIKYKQRGAMSIGSSFINIGYTSHCRKAERACVKCFQCVKLVTCKLIPVMLLQE